jgi:hypothetical protein
MFSITLWLFNIAMENGPFIDDFPIKTSIYKGFSMATLNNQMVTIELLGYSILTQAPNHLKVTRDLLSNYVYRRYIV